MTDTTQNLQKTTQQQTKSKKRIADHGEVFTNEREVNAMLDLLPKTIWQNVDKTFLEPACGTGNFLAEILSRKLATALAMSQIKTNKSQKTPRYSQVRYEQYAIHAISSIYGIELLADNCVECRARLLSLFSHHYSSHFKDINEQVLQSAEFLLTKNIINGDALSLKDNTGEPIIFSKWKPINNVQIQRHEFTYENLVEKLDNNAPIDKGFIYKPKRDFSLIHFLHIAQQG